MAAGQRDSVELRELLARRGIRPTRQRLRVLEELAREPDDATAQELHRRLVAGGEQIGLATVYRALGTLSGRGVVDTFAHAAGEVCYRLCGDAHHHHLVCSGCHRVMEIGECGLDAWLEEVTSVHDFVATEHRVEIVGLCGDCRRAA